MEQQMTSEKQMTVHRHISVEFPVLLQHTIIPMCLCFYVDFLVDYSFFLYCLSLPLFLQAYPTLIHSQYIHLFIFRTTSQPVIRALSAKLCNWKQTR